MKSCTKIPCSPCRGLTLVELIVVVAILAVLAALAAPTLSEVVARYQTQTTEEQLNSLIARAQTEALRRSGFVRLEKKAADGAGVNPCAAAKDWSCGVRLMVDMDKDGRYETILDEIRVPTGVTLTNVSTTSSGGADKLPFDRWGRAANTIKLGFIQTKVGFASANQAVCVDTTNRIRTSKPTNLDTPCS